MMHPRSMALRNVAIHTRHCVRLLMMARRIDAAAAARDYGMR